MYQVYPRSFQDSNGDGIGDVRGMTSRLDHLKFLGVDAVWMSPMFKSPQADFGYDVSDYTDVSPEYGTREDVDALVHGAHERDIEVLLDLVPSHTSIEHPWFREHPDWYIWADGDAPPNNWVAVFGGSAWTRDNQTGRWYMHSFYPEQPDLQWRNPAVAHAMHDQMRFWLDRGVDGFRIDAIPHIMKDAALRDEPPSGIANPRREYATLEHCYTKDLPEVQDVIAGFRRAFPSAFFAAEAVVPTPDLAPYLKNVDLAFCFDFLFCTLDAEKMREVIAEGARHGGITWLLSNHDFSRLVTRWGPGLARVAAMLLLTLPGAAVIYQGDEIGMVDGPGSPQPFDRYGRDKYRHPMQWTRDGGFTTGTPWLTMTNSAQCNVADQMNDPGSMLSFYRNLITLRRDFPDDFDLLPSDEGVIVYGRGDYLVVINLANEEQRAPEHGDVVMTTGSIPAGGTIPPHSGYVARRTRS